MLIPNLLLLYVENPQNSAAFYEHLFGIPPTAAYPTYVAFEFENGLTLSLWSTSAKNFVSGGSGHRSEVAFMVPNDQMVSDLHERWSKAGVTIEQPLHEAVFGLTFVAIDPDGHRIRVCTPDE
ncbi:MAG TPA: VOC family protein [Pedomonas sp.]|uniref:VOC family protein n=1 Tax=Pedomonas sp. TaxID=2976421 RepID=UPI002F40F1FD